MTTFCDLQLKKLLIIFTKDLCCQLWNNIFKNRLCETVSKALLSEIKLWSHGFINRKVIE